MNSVIRMSGLALAILLSLLFWQNCSKETGSYSVSQPSTSLSQEDDVWFRIESAKIKITQLNTISAFTDSVSTEILDGQSPSGLATELQRDIDELLRMIKTDKIPMNHPDILKKYTSLVDLLSRARDLLLAYYMNIGFENAAKNLEEAKKNLQASLDLLSASHASLRLAHDQFVSDVTKEGGLLDQAKKELRQEIIAAETRLSKKVDDTKIEILNTISKINDDLKSRIASSEVAIKNNSEDIKSLDQRLKEIETKLKPQVEHLISLAEQTRKELEALVAEFEALRTSGKDSYDKMVSAWQCSEDLIDKDGSHLLNLPPSIHEKCVLSKEETLYTICVERYPTFCGPCKGKSMEKCSHWQEWLSPREKLELLINIRQEISIEYLAQQTSLHKQAIFGGNSCKQECLKLDNGGLFASCKVSDLNQCGIEGKLMALHLNDISIIENVMNLSNSIDERMASMEDSFASAQEYSIQRFSDLQSYVDSELSSLRKTTEAQLSQVATALSGLPFVPDSIRDDVDTLAAEAAIAEQDAANHLQLVPAPVAQIQGFDNLSANQIHLLFSHDIESLMNVLAQGAIGENGAIGSLSAIMISIMRSTFESLAADQTSIPEYDAKLSEMVATHCPAEARFKTPFTNVVGRDPMEILAIGLARRVVFGDGQAEINGAKTIFHPYQKSLVSGSQLQQAFIAAALDYRKDVSISVPQACLQALDKYTREIFSSATFTTKAKRQGAIVTMALTNSELIADALALSEQMKLVLRKLSNMEETILTRSIIDPNSDRYRKIMSEIALRVIRAGTSQIIAKIKHQEFVNLIEIGRDESNSSFQRQFDAALNAYSEQKQKLAKLVETAMINVDVLQKELEQQKRDNTALTAKVNRIGAAVGFLQAHQAHSNREIDQLQKQVKHIIKSIEKPPQPPQFSPVIKAVRHTFEGTGRANCGERALSALAFPTNNQFVGGHLKCGVNFRIVSGHGGGNNWAWGTNQASQMWIKAWGSATDIMASVQIGTKTNTADFSFVDLTVGQITAQGNNKVKLAHGSPESGAFMFNAPGLFNNITTAISNFKGSIELTPRNRFNGEIGKKVTYSATFYSPLVLKFSPEANIKTLSINEGVRFNLMNNGRKQQVGWVDALEGAFLIYDRNKNGQVDNGSEMFGEATLSKAHKKFNNGFDALAEYDSNKDKVIDAKDKVYGQLQLWFDLNQDGISQANELVGLTKLNIQSISLDYKDVDKAQQDNAGNKILYSATFHGPKICGTRGCIIYDVFFNNIDVKYEQLLGSL